MKIAAKGSKKPQQGGKPLLAEPLAKIIYLRCVVKYFQILLEIGVFQQNIRLAAVGSFQTLTYIQVCCDAAAKGAIQILIRNHWLGTVLEFMGMDSDTLPICSRHGRSQITYWENAA